MFSPNNVSSDMEYWFGGDDLAKVRLQEGESIESALRQFKRRVQTEDIIEEVKRHFFCLKPGAKRRVKEDLARKRPVRRFAASYFVPVVFGCLSIFLSAPSFASAARLSLS